jgi:membrane dipeptidase
MVLRLRAKALGGAPEGDVGFGEDHARRTAAGIAAPNESAGSLPFIPELSGPEQFQTLSRLLAAHGHCSSRIEKILSGNVLRFARHVWGC